MNGTGIGRNSTGYINGNIDEVRIYNRTLSASEVLDLYNLESSCFSDWSNWTSSSYMNDGIANKSLTFGKFFQFRAFFEINDTEVSPYLLNHSVGFGGAGDNTPPTFTTIPANASLFYGNQSLNVTFVATDETSFGYYSINDTRFSIDNPGGFLSNATPMAVGNYEINVTINDTYTIQVNKSNYYDCGVYFNATSGINYPDNFIVYTNCSSDYKLYQNESEISNATTINSGAGYYNLTVQRTDIANYTNTIDSQFFSVNKNDENCQVLFNETSPLKYPGTFLVWANCTTAFVLARNGTTIENNSEQALEVGAYNFSMSRNDTSNYSIYYNESQFIINENIHPIYTENSTNNTFAGISTNFSINVTDNSALQPNGMYIFSTNNTGNWVNDSGVNFTAISQWANVTKTLNSTVGTIVGYRWFFNDSIGNTNSTPIYVVTTTIGEHLTLTKNASLNSENTTHVNYTLTIEVLNSGEVNLTSITVLDSELDLNALINLDINESYNSSNFTIIAKTISDSQKTFVKSTATVNSVTYFSNQVTINISGYGGPADAIVYAPASVSSSTSFDTIITVKNNNSDIGQDFTVDYWITNEAETTNYSSGQQTIYVAISGSSNLTAALTSPTSDGNYRFKALVTWGGGTATAYDTFVVSTPAAEEVQSRQGGGGTSRTTGEVVEEVVCNSPYIRHGKECCLDINNNSICDPDEVIKEGVNETSEINETYRGKGTSNKPILDFIKKTWNKIKKLSLLVYEFASENKVYLIEGGIALLILGILILLSIRLPSRLKHISKIKRKKPKTLKDMLGLEVYDREGNRIGKIKDIYIEKGKSKIYGWLIKIDRKKSRKKKNILIRHKYVKSISHIMIIDERVLRNIDKKQ
jgi:sporulation protein YlmC with PRC-barrel domain